MQPLRHAGRYRDARARSRSTTPAAPAAACNGFGATLEYDESLIVPDPARSLARGAIDPWTKPRYEGRRRILLERARQLDVDPDTPWSKLKAAQKRELLYGKKGRYVGIFPFLKGLEEKRYKQYIRVFLRQYQLARTCTACQGTRLNPDALAVRIGVDTIADVAALHGRRDPRVGPGPAAHGHGAAGRPTDPGSARRAARLPARRRPGVPHARAPDAYALRRRSPAHRARERARARAWSTRCTCWTSRRSGCIPRDTDRLLAPAAPTPRQRQHRRRRRARPRRDPPGATSCWSWAPARASAAGAWSTRARSPTRAASLTGQYLDRRSSVSPCPARAGRPGPRWLRVRGAELHNLEAVDVDIPLGTLDAS